MCDFNYFIRYNVCMCIHIRMRFSMELISKHGISNVRNVFFYSHTKYTHYCSVHLSVVMWKYEFCFSKTIWTDRTWNYWYQNKCQTVFVPSKLGKHFKKVRTTYAVLFIAIIYGIVSCVRVCVTWIYENHSFECHE